MSRVLDMACGSRMFWHNREHPNAIYLDNRQASYLLPDKSTRGGVRALTIRPTVQADFTNLPFRNDQFDCVVFDPPHLIGAGKNGWLAKKYGVLPSEWKDIVTRGFDEGFRVLRPNGMFILKWSSHSVKIGNVLALTVRQPLFGSQRNRHASTHWVMFAKEDCHILKRPSVTLANAVTMGRK